MTISPRFLRLLLASGVLALAALLLGGYVTDDTYIHLRYVQNLLTRGEFAFNPGQNTYGATSPLWISGLLLLHKAGLAPVPAAHLLGVLAAFLTLLLLDALVSSRPWPRLWQAAVLLLAAADAWFLRWSLSGMETPLATALLLLLLWPLLPAGQAPQHSRHFLAWGVAAGLAGLVRPEFLLLGPLALPWLLWHEAQRRMRHEHRSAAGLPHLAAAALVGWLLAAGPWLLFAWRLFGRWTPETATAKSFAVTLAPGPVLANLARSLMQLGATQGLLWAAVVMVLLVSLPAWRARPTDHALRAAQAGGVEQSRKRQRTACDSADIALCGIALTWTAVLLGGYALKQVWVISRYLSPLSPVLLLALAVFSRWLLAFLRPDTKGRQIALAALGTGCLATLAVNAWLLLAEVRPHARSFSRGVRECYLTTGEWLRRNSAPDAIVAALDIGAVGYASQRQVLDLMGLVSPEILTLGRELGFAEMVESGAWLQAAPDYLVDRSLGEPRWTGSEAHGTRFELLRTCDIKGVGLREPQVWTVALYRLHRREGAP